MDADARLGQSVDRRRRARLMSYRSWNVLARAAKPAGAIINADDWGVDRLATRRIMDCVSARSVTAVSAMVFMDGSADAADLAASRGIDAGLHLNLTTRFSASGLPERLAGHHGRVASYLASYRLAPYVYHPGLTASFEYLVLAQLEEFQRLYGAPPERVDGHHHMHLCANVMAAHLLPRDLVIRRNFTFAQGEKSALNRLARRAYDSRLLRRYRMVDALVALAPLSSPDRLARLFARACHESVEVETHPANADEYRFLTDGGLAPFVELPVD